MTLQDGSASPFMDTKVVSDVGCVFLPCFTYIKICTLILLCFHLKSRFFKCINRSTTKLSPWNSPSSNLCVSVSEFHCMIGECGCSCSFQFRESGQNSLVFFSFLRKKYIHLFVHVEIVFFHHVSWGATHDPQVYLLLVWLSRCQPSRLWCLRHGAV